jgi:hypothetical protein
LRSGAPVLHERRRSRRAKRASSLSVEQRSDLVGREPVEVVRHAALPFHEPQAATPSTVLGRFTILTAGVRGSSGRFFGVRHASGSINLSLAIARGVCSSQLAFAQRRTCLVERSKSGNGRSWPGNEPAARDGRG